MVKILLVLCVAGVLGCRAANERPWPVVDMIDGHDDSRVKSYDHPFFGIGTVPGALVMIFRSTPTQEWRREFKEGFGLEECLFGERADHVKIDGQEAAVVQYECTVPDGAEYFWLEVFHNVPEIEAVGWRRYQLPSVETVTEVRQSVIGAHLPLLPPELANRKRRLALPNKLFIDKSPGVVGEIIKRFYQERFPVKVQVLKQGSNYLKLRLDGLKNEVLRNGLWERLDIYFVFFPVDQAIQLHSVFDGYYGAGLGRQMPLELTDMTKDRYKELSEYAQTMTTKLEAFMK